MKPSKKNSVRKPSVKKLEETKVQSKTEQPPEGTQNNRELKAAKDHVDTLTEYRFKENVFNDFDKYESQYLSEISELFSCFEEEFAPGYLLTDEDPLELIPSLVPYYRVFLSGIVDLVGNEKPFEDGCFEIEDIRKSATVRTFNFFSDEQVDSKKEKYFRNVAKEGYRQAIAGYAWFDIRFKKILESLGIESNLKEI